MQERGHNVFITNSVDKTIRVWDVDNVLEVVHPLDRLLTSIDDLQRLPLYLLCDLDRMGSRIEKLVLCENANLVMSVTRNGLGFWNLTTGALDFVEADTPAGGE